FLPALTPRLTPLALVLSWFWMSLNESVPVATLLSPSLTACPLLLITPPRKSVFPATWTWNPASPARIPLCSCTLANSLWTLLWLAFALTPAPAPTVPETLTLWRLPSTVEVSCRLSLFRLPLTFTSTWLPLATAPFSVVSPPLAIVSLLPASTWVLTWVVPSPSTLPRLALALAVRPYDVSLRPISADTPTAALQLLLSLCWLSVSCAANRLTWLSADRDTFPAARTSLPTTSMLL